MPVAISRQILWLGAEIYPLRNIARARKLKRVPKRAAAWRHWLIAVVAWAILGVVANAALNAAWSQTTSAEARKAISNGQTAVVVVVLVLIALSTIRLIVVLRRKTRYMLILETAGAQHAALVTPNQKDIDDLVREIMAAIDDPHVEYHTTVESLHIGDKIEQFGSQNVGKVSR